MPTCLSGYLWYLQVKLPPTVHLLQDKGKLMDFLLRRRDCKLVILSVCAQSRSQRTGSLQDQDQDLLSLTSPVPGSVPVLDGQEKGSLPVVATVFDKLNQVYKDYLDADQSYTAVSSGTVRSPRPGFRLKSSCGFCRPWSPVPVEAAPLRSGRSEPRRSSTSRTCTPTSCQPSPRPRYQTGRSRPEPPLDLQLDLNAAVSLCPCRTCPTSSSSLSSWSTSAL